jgi:hypothetical protein
MDNKLPIEINLGWTRLTMHVDINRCRLLCRPTVGLSECKGYTWRIGGLFTNAVMHQPKTQIHMLRCQDL